MKKVIKEEGLIYSLMGERLTKLRKQKGFSNQEFFAYESKIPRAQYARYEKGCNMTLISLFQILKAHKMTFKQFFGEGFEKLDRAMK